MNDLRTDLAALKLDRDARGAAVRSPGRWVALVLVLLAAGGGWWYWNRPVIAQVKTTPVVARGGGARLGR